MATATPARRSLLSDIAVGLYAGIGAVALSAYASQSLILVEMRLPPMVSQPLVHLMMLLGPTASPLLAVAAAVLAWLWLARSGRGTLATRVTAAAVLAAATIYSAAHMSVLSPRALPTISRPGAQLLLVALVAVGLLLWLPVPRRWRPPSRRWARRALLLLPLLPLVLAAQQQVRIRLVLRASEQRLAQLQVPVPPGAVDELDSYRNGSRTITFTVRETYPSTALLDFYGRHFAAQSWRSGSRSTKWTEPSFYSSRRARGQAHAQLSYGAAWTSPDGETLCLLRLSYEGPQSTAPRLPVEQWPPEALQVQHVNLVLMPEKPFG